MSKRSGGRFTATCNVVLKMKKKRFNLRIISNAKKVCFISFIISTNISENNEIY